MYEFSDELIESVFEQSKEYVLTEPEANEFIVSDMVKEDPRGWDRSKWRRILNEMVDDGELEKRWGRHPDNGTKCWVYKKSQ